MTNSMPSLLLIIPFAIYILGMVAIGWVFYFRTRDLSDYVLGGRRLNSWVTSLSAQASDMSGWLLLGLPGYAYIAGLEAFWIAAGLSVGTYLNWKVVAPRLRQYTQQYGNAITIPDYFENRFAAQSGLLRPLSALFILIFFMIYTASGFVAGAKLFSSVFGLPYLTALTVGVLVIIFYTFLGGFMAVCWTDLIQGSIMFAAILIVPVLVIRSTGGLRVSLQSIMNSNPQLLNILTNRSGVPLTALNIISLAAWGLGYFGQPHILARFMAIQHVNAIPRARRIAMVWVIACLTGAVAVGLFAHPFLKQDLTDSLAETVFIRLIQSHLVSPLVAGFLLSAVLAAIMSTADSQLLVASTALTEDLYRLFFRRQAAQKERIWVSRAAVILIALVAFSIGTDPESSVLNLVAYAWAGFGAAFGPLILFSFWSGMNETGALAGLITGGLTVLVWKHLHGGWFDLYEIVPGFVLSSLAIFIGSRLRSRSAGP
jgi:sodium/proline symporter